MCILLLYIYSSTHKSRLVTVNRDPTRHQMKERHAGTAARSEIVCGSPWIIAGYLGIVEEYRGMGHLRNN